MALPIPMIFAAYNGPAIALKVQPSGGGDMSLGIAGPLASVDDISGALNNAAAGALFPGDFYLSVVGGRLVLDVQGGGGWQPWTLRASLMSAADRAFLGTGAVDLASADIVDGIAHLSRISLPNVLARLWQAQDPPLDDTRDVAEYERAAARSLSGRAKAVHFATRYRRTVKLGFLPAYKTWKADGGVAHAGEAIERLFDDGWARFTYYSDANGSADGVYMFDDETRKAMQRARLSPGNPVYSITLGMLKIA
jgi:hypothetical protein